MIVEFPNHDSLAECLIADELSRLRNEIKALRAERDALRAALKQAVARQGFTNKELISARALIANATGENK